MEINEFHGDSGPPLAGQFGERGTPAAAVAFSLRSVESLGPKSGGQAVAKNRCENLAWSGSRAISSSGSLRKSARNNWLHGDLLLWIRVS